MLQIKSKINVYKKLHCMEFREKGTSKRSNMKKASIVSKSEKEAII